MYIKIDQEKTVVVDSIPVKGASTFVCESEADIANLPTKASEVSVCSKAIVIPTGDAWLLGPSRTWIKYGGGSSL